MENLNILIIIIATIISTIIGAFWYSPILFGNKWMKLSKISKKDFSKMNKSQILQIYILNFVSTMILIFVLDTFLRALNLNSIFYAVVTSILIWVGFIATTMLTPVLWEQKPKELYIINSVHYLVILIISSIILTI